MAVPEQTPYIEYTANGTTTVFPLEFDCDNSEYLIVSLDKVEAPVGSWQLSNGTVVFNAAPLNGVLVSIERNTPLQRTTNYQSYDNSFRPSPVNRDFDLIWWKLQELGYRDQVIWLALLKEISDRIDGDENLQNQINTIDEWLENLQENVDQNTSDITQLVADLSKEIADRISNDAALKELFLSMLDEAINEGTINALAVTHIESVDDLENITNVWDGRTVYVKGVGNYQYNASTQNWVLTGNSATGTNDDSGKSQQQINDASIYTVGSVAEMLGLNEKFRPRTIRIKATGSMYIYDESKVNINDGFYTLNGWVLVGFHDRLVAKTAGLKGDGTNEFTKIKSLFDVASALDMPVHMCGLKVSTSNLVASGNLKLIGTGGIKLFAGSQGTLLNTAYNLIVHGEIEFDQNKANNAGGVIGAETHCAIKHSGDILDLKGAKFKPSTSINVVTRAVKKVSCEDLEIDGGMIGLYVIPGANAKVEVFRGEYMNAHQYDNIQILNGSDITVEGVKSHDAARSCIVISNYTAKARIYANTAYGGKVDAANQGGWGIIASVKSQDSIVSLNNCFGNQRGPMTIDVYPDSGAGVDNRIIVSGNTCNAEYNGTYGTSGIVLNDTKHANVFGNIIFRAAQGMVCVDADYSNIHGNTFIDCRDYFLTAVTSHNLVFSGKNICDGCPVTGAAAIRFLDCNQFHSGNNVIRNLTGAAPFIYRVSGNSKDWTIEAEDCIKAGAGTGYMFHIIGAGNTGGRIVRNRIKAPGVKGFDWYIASDNLAQFSSFENEIDSAGTGYITSGANTVTAGDDKFNGSKNFFATAPTTFKSMTGQQATIGGVQKVWNGSAWA